MAIKILSWNILSGGFKDYGSTDTKPPRLDDLTKVINEIKPDLVCLIDTYRWTEIFSPAQLQQIFGYPNVHLVKLEDERLIAKGHDNGITVLSLIPQTQMHTIRLATRNAIKISTGGMEVFAVYLDDLSETTRLEQVEEVLKLVNPNIPTIITGDFNSIDASDLAKTNLHLQELSLKFPAPMKSMENSLNEMKRGEVTKLLLENDFIDLGKGLGNTIPAKLFPLPTEKPIARIDYAFGNKLINKVNFDVLTANEFGNLSDHYPILIEVSSH